MTREPRFRALALSLFVGALYDLGFGASMLVFHEPASRLLGLAVPDDPFYLRFAGLLLLILGSAYLLAAASPVRHQGVAVVAACGRLAGFWFLLAAWNAGRGAVFLPLALADLAFGIAHAGLLLHARRTTSGS